MAFMQNNDPLLNLPSHEKILPLVRNALINILNGTHLRELSSFQKHLLEKAIAHFRELTKKELREILELVDKYRQ